MAEARPTIGPGGPQANVTNSETSMPGQNPPTGAGVETLAPPIVGMGDAAPSLPMTAGVTAGVAAWQNNKRISALWSINQNRNSWVGVDGIGWKKLVNNSDSAIVALTMLASHAREKGSVVNYREESDGMIYEMYVW
ncbi:hypothetical protein KDA23_05380 [Candidatus Saccharibacteria bacterium]|nr:hypothetical protein [Candidatus Saccharibacteria bacterium]MCA9333665.1 hypothetical protein [Candidatus Saccharibacteria bacterium]